MQNNDVLLKNALTNFKQQLENLEYVLQKQSAGENTAWEDSASLKKVVGEFDPFDTLLVDLTSLKKAVGEFYEQFSDDSFEALVEKINTIPLENIGKITQKQELLAVKAVLAEMLDTMQKTYEEIRSLGIPTPLLRDFNEYVITSFKMQKDVADKFIEQKIREMAKKVVTFELSLENVRRRLERFKNDPTPWNLNSLGSSLKFDFRSLDRSTRFKKVG